MYYSKLWQDKNKALEIQTDVYDESTDIFATSVRWDRNCDHAGFRFEITVWKWSFYFHFYDSRHWNEDEKRWMTKEDYKNMYSDS